MMKIGRRCVVFCLWIIAAPIGPAAVISTVAAQSAAAPLYETELKMMNVHHDINPAATPVPVEEAAAMHAAMIVSPRVAKRADDKFRLRELSSLVGLPAEDVPKAISAATKAVARPSGDAANATIVEIRYRSVNYVDALTLNKAIFAAYREFLREQEPMLDDKLKQAIRLHEELTRTCDELHAGNKAGELARAEASLREARTERYRLALKARVGRFGIELLELPDGAVKVSD